MESDSWSACSWYWPHGFSRPSICEDRHHQIIWTAGLGSSFGVPRHHMDGSAVQQLGVHVWLSAWIFSSEIKVISTAFQTHWLSCLHKKKMRSRGTTHRAWYRSEGRNETTEICKVSSEPCMHDRGNPDYPSVKLGNRIARRVCYLSVPQVLCRCTNVNTVQL